ncbi:Gfo/Idh/MocA family oxidoreductase [Microbacterium sp. LMI12-1-1.1]|uniref:Gfo/Idh/MocA family protein n=1 Tax=Microbacterium sp. LMI12-1-1.1 TaxID=3135225 RepID=UPI00341E64A4
MRSGVGVIGAGPGVSALHLPTLARLADRFEVVHVSDGGSGGAAALAARSGAAHSVGAAELLADPRVETVAICSPPHLHAAQVRAAVAAGKRGVLCEKPLALTQDEAEAVIQECRAAGTALVVGTNHLFDPAWVSAKHHLVAHGGRVRTVSITVALPPNARYHDLVTEFAPAAESPTRRQPDWGDAEVAASVVRQLIVGLGVHDLPIVRDLAPRLEEVVYARPVAPIGFAVGFVAGGVLVQLNAVMLPGGADALWRMTIGTSLDELEVQFRPAFTHDGSAVVRVRDIEGRVIEYPRSAGDGYVAEWEALAATLDGAEVVEYDELLADARYAIDLADAAADAVREAMAS